MDDATVTGVGPYTMDRLMARRAIDPRTGWLWTGAKKKSGYGIVNIKGRIWKVTRIVAELVQLRGEGPWVLHACDRPSCFNPDHLFKGTRADNTKDASEKGLLFRHTMRHLTKEQAAELRRRYMAQEGSLKHLAEQYGITAEPARRIILGLNYRDAR